MKSIFNAKENSMPTKKQPSRFSEVQTKAQSLATSLRFRLLEYGENREGYWAYNNMVLQFEDAVDVLKVIHPSVDFVFLFDHSSGHSKQRPDGLNQHRMNRLFGGKNAPSMRNTIIEHEEGYL
jgi:hypothetical protein